MRRAVCPGSFDPVTYGHVDMVGRAARIFDEVYVAVLVNEAKQGMFATDERIAMLHDATAEWGNVHVEAFEGLLVDYCISRSVETIVKGLRAGGDFDYELQMAHMNRTLTGVDTMFVPTSPQWSFVSSSLIKEIASHGGDVAPLVPAYVLDRLHDHLRT